jgi:hypothetical protein
MSHLRQSGSEHAWLRFAFVSQSRRIIFTGAAPDGVVIVLFFKMVIIQLALFVPANRLR